MFLSVSLYQIHVLFNFGLIFSVIFLSFIYSSV